MRADHRVGLAFALARIEERAEDLRAAEAPLAEAVAEARDQGATWAEVGRVLGVSRQAAQQRFGRRR